MWIATEHGYFSTVADRPDPHGTHVWVRARALDDLQRVRDAGYDIGHIVAMEEADYPYRVYVARSEWSRYVGDQISTMSYTNFKNRVHEVDPERAGIYMEVWYDLTRIEDADPDRTTVRRMVAAEAVAE